MPIDAYPPSPEVFYATNNRFLANGPKGFVECKTLENDDMYLRIDLPGVSEVDVTVNFDPYWRKVSIVADAPMIREDFSIRSYNSTNLEHILNVYGINTNRFCMYCRYTAVTSYNMSDGVLRLILTKDPDIPIRYEPERLSLTKKETHTTTGSTRCIYCGGTFHLGTDPYDSELSGPTLMPHPGVTRGLQMDYESKRLRNGRTLYVRVDMPGVPKENFTVSVMDGRVHVTGEAPALSHDSGGRFYSGDVAKLPESAPNIRVSHLIETITGNGVIRLVIRLV